MTPYLLDTNVLSELRKPRPDRAVEAFVQSQALDDLFICDVTLAEIGFGADIREDPREKAVILNWLDGVIRPMFEGRCLSADEKAWRVWKMLEYDGRRMGHTYPQPDLVIASIALLNGLTVVTRDVEPFRRAGVAVSNPWRASRK
jgi:predicted nucleic acid-binding protein